MKVVFLQDVLQVGKKWEIKQIRDGYARNFLFPRRLAVIASPKELRDIEACKAKIKEAQNSRAEQFTHAIGLLNGKTITLPRKAGGKGKLFAGVTAADIARELTKITGVAVPREAVELAEPIKTPGTYSVSVSLSGVKEKADVTVTITALS